MLNIDIYIMKKPSFLKNDILAGLVVFLVALPLCLGIALASGAPMFSGIIAGVIGGLCVGAISGSHTAVSGPAAGLIIIVVNAIQDLGAYDMFLTAVILAGLFQIILGICKAGIIGLYFPSNVIKGMLSAIGLILILKQIPHLLGVDKDAFGEEEFFQKDGATTFSYLLDALAEIHLGVLAAGLLSISILLIWDSKTIKQNTLLKQIPGALIAVVAAVILNVLLLNFAPSLAISGAHLVSLPSITSANDLSGLLVFPNLSVIGNKDVVICAITLAVVASLETLLSLEAADKLDPMKRSSPQNRELIAQGSGNILSGLIGGLPITAVIVRSSANINAGAKTKTATIVHGLFLTLAVLVFSKMLNYIPLASLAAILILVGYKLTKPMLYIQQYKLGWNQFIPFIVTIVAILFSDLLIGIIIGMAVGVFYILKANYEIPYYVSEETNQGDQKINIRLSEHVSFLNKPSLYAKLNELPSGSNITIDGSTTKTIDYDVLEMLHHYKRQSKEKGISLTLISIPEVETETDSH